LAPVLVNIVLFHAFLAPSGIGLAVVLVTLQLVLAWTRRDAYRPLLRARA
jgi:cytochrome bd-type quinol oxidase subunit 1